MQLWCIRCVTVDTILKPEACGCKACQSQLKLVLSLRYSMLVFMFQCRYSGFKIVCEYTIISRIAFPLSES